MNCLVIGEQRSNRIYDHKNKLNCQLEASPWLSCQSIVLDPAHSLLNLMTSAFSHFKASGVPLTVNLQPWLVATGVYPRNPQWPTRSLYGPRGGTAGLHGRPERQFHLWHLFSPRRGRTPSLTDIP